MRRSSHVSLGETRAGSRKYPIEQEKNRKEQRGGNGAGRSLEACQPSRVTGSRTSVMSGVCKRNFYTKHIDETKSRFEAVMGFTRCGGTSSYHVTLSLDCYDPRVSQRSMGGWPSHWEARSMRRYSDTMSLQGLYDEITTSKRHRPAQIRHPGTQPPAGTAGTAGTQYNPRPTQIMQCSSNI